MREKNIFPKLKKNLSSFIHDEDGVVIRSKAAIVGPLAVGAVILMGKEMSIEAQATKYTSHRSHTSHRSSPSGKTVQTSHQNNTPAHSSHSSGTTSGFSHTAGTFKAEGRSSANN